MKTLLIHNAYQHPGGEDAVFEREAALLREHGHTVVTYTRSNAEVRDFSPAAKALLPLRMVWARDAVRDLRALIAAEKPDVAHFHNTHFMISPAAYIACREAGVPVVQTLHNYRLSCPAATFTRDGRICEDCLGKGIAWPGVVHACYHNSRGLTGAVAATLAFHRLRRTWSQAVDAYIALTEFGRQKFVQAGLPAHKITVKPNFVSPDPGWREPRGNYAIYMGRLSPEKGCRELLHAWQSLGGISLKVVGAGPLRDELVGYAGRHRLAQVEFVDWLPREAVLNLLGHARAMIFPSTWYEGLPMSIIEAFACGVPVIASRTGVMAEIVTDGVTGLHFAPGDAADLAAKVRWAWDHPAEMAEMGRAARREYEQKYTAERNYAQLLRIYESVRGG
ncbi:MAG: glycosyltransferase family 4 protein [Anaerolineae bacterium]|nr:glycosyltransferase family 4 protein [Anaerolineae bacterium]